MIDIIRDLLFIVNKSYCGLVGRLYSELSSTEFFIESRTEPKSAKIVYLDIKFKFDLFSRS